MKLTIISAVTITGVFASSPGLADEAADLAVAKEKLKVQAAQIGIRPANRILTARPAVPHLRSHGAQVVGAVGVARGAVEGERSRGLGVRAS